MLQVKQFLGGTKMQTIALNLNLETHAVPFNAYFDLNLATTSHCICLCHCIFGSFKDFFNAKMIHFFLSDENK